MRNVYLGCAIVLSSAFIWAISILATAIALPELNIGGWDGNIGMFASAYVQIGGIFISVICISLFVFGIVLALKKSTM